MLLTRRITAVAGAIVVTAAGVASGPLAGAAAASSGPTAARPGRCAVSHLRAAVIFRTPAAGAENVLIRLGNIGAPCTLDGYGRYVLLNAHHHRLGTHVHDGRTIFGPDPGKHPVTLRDGGRVYADLAWEANGNPGQPERVAYLRVYAPGAVHFLTVRFAELVNGGGLTGTAFASHPEVSQ